MRGDWKTPFLACLERDGRETVCAELAGVTDRAVRYAKRDPEFRVLVDWTHAARIDRYITQSLRTQRRRASFED